MRQLDLNKAFVSVFQKDGFKQPVRFRRMEMALNENI